MQIWDDPDVSRISVLQGGQPQLLFPELDSDDLTLMKEFVNADMKVDESTAVARLVIDALVAGVKAFEGFADPMPRSWAPGWKKFVLYYTGCNVKILSAQFPASQETAIFADWVTYSIGHNGWGPDGNVSALGHLHSDSMAVAANAGGGVRMNPATGKFEAPDGSAARRFRT